MTETAPTVAIVKQKPGKVEKANHYLGFFSTTIGICGALGTLFVWLAANFYVGDVVVLTDHPVSSLTIKVYDRKGQEATFHTDKFQLMPGKYHFDIAPDGAKTSHADVQVRFSKKTVIPVSVVPGVDSLSDDDTRPVKKHWWQFWRS